MTHPSPAFANALPDDAIRAVTEFERDLVAGLSTRPYRLSPKYLYDPAGSALFDRICTLPEYYLTRAELGILSQHGTEMTAHIGPNVDLVEFGAGSLTKIRLLLNAFAPECRPVRYLPVDISGEHLTSAANALSTAYPDIIVEPVVGDYTAPIKWPDGPHRRRVGFFPGSTLGNFEPDDAVAFLKSAATQLRGGGLLIGIDLVKEPLALHRAYNDQEGVTAAFNRNVLRRANRELGTNFDLKGFRHYAFYNPPLRRIEMHLVCVRPQIVTLGDRRFVFNEGDNIHTESSYKYGLAGFRELASAAGFRPKATWFDPERLFSMHWLEAPADSPPLSD